MIALQIAAFLIVTVCCVEGIRSFADRIARRFE